MQGFNTPRRCIKLRSISEFINLWLRILGSDTASRRSNASIIEYHSERINEIEKVDSAIFDELISKISEIRDILSIINSRINAQLETVRYLSRRRRELNSEIEELIKLKKMNENKIESLDLLLGKHMEIFGKKSRKENTIFFLLGVLIAVVLHLLSG